jgi:hypothetical protein
MAQETAGTIGIPVLRNEVLPYLTDYAKRRERAELYKQKAEQRAAELAAKKAAEVDKYIPPPFETAKGGYWQPAIKQRMEAEQKSALQRIASATTQAEKARAAQDYSSIMQELNYGGELETQKQKENLKALGESGYVADENALSQYYREQAATNPTFFETNHITGFQKWLQNNPEKYINPAAIGTALLKQFKPQNIEVTNRNRETERFEFNPLFTPERKYDNVAKAEVISADKVNPDAAYKALQSNKALLGAADKYIENYAQKIKTPGMSDTEAYTLATDKFFGEALQQGRGGQKYDYSLQFKGAGKGAKKEEETTQIVETPITATVYQDVVNPGGGQPTQRVVEANFGVGQNITLPKNRKVQVGANRKVFVLGGDVNKAVQEGILKPSGLGDGSYVLNYGFDVQTYQKPKAVYRLTKDYDFIQKGGGNIRYKAGSVLDVNKVNLLKQAGATDAYKAIPSPIRISPGMFQWSEAVEQYKMPTMRNLDLIISESEIPDLKQAEKGGSKISASDESPIGL